jgi:hypothetical protein
MTSLVGGETMLGKATTVIVTDIDVSLFAFEEKEGRFTDTVEIVLVATHQESSEFWDRSETVELGVTAEARDRLASSPWYSLTRDFDLPPGTYQSKIAIRHKKSGRMGTVTHEFVVPPLSEWRVSSVLMTDAVGRDKEQGAAQLKPVARRSFKSGGMVFGRFEVFGAMKDEATRLPRVSSGHVIRAKDGTVVSVADPSAIKPTPKGEVVRTLGFRADGWAPGEYELVLTVKDEISEKSREVREPFTIEAAAAEAPVIARPSS